MCGFFGLISFGKTLDREELKKVAEAVSYRGRDEENDYLDSSCYLAHYRLSIIDIEGGKQPFLDSDERYAMVYNGEVYNYKELRADLEQQGVQFKTESDTEVFLKGFVQGGHAFLKRAEGMFAAVIWDKKEKKVILIRDTLGKKPLFVWQTEQFLAFSSTLQCFKLLPGWKGELNRAALAHFIRTGFIPPPLSIYKDCKKVMPGFSQEMDITDKKWQMFRYRTLKFTGEKSAYSEKDTSKILQEALKIRLRADVPLAMTFSGGVDSGLLGCFARELNTSLTLFNIDYESDQDKSPERANARLAANRLDFKLIEEQFVPGSLFSNLGESYQYYDEPCSQLPMVYSYQILKIVHQYGIKVVLTGNGADELFFGYNGNFRLRQQNIAFKMLTSLPELLLPEKIKAFKGDNFLKHLLGSEEKGILSCGDTMNWDVDELHHQSKEYLGFYEDELKESSPKDYLDYCFWRNIRYNGAVANYLLADISGMHAQVEVRSPFLDMSVVELAAKMKSYMKIGSIFSDKHNKNILKKMYAKKLGADLAYDQKRGMAWNIRFDRWIREMPLLRNFFDKTIQKLNEYDINATYFLNGFNDFCSTQSPEGGNRTMFGFMLAIWLTKEFEGCEALDEWLSPLSSFDPSE